MEVGEIHQEQGAREEGNRILMEPLLLWIDGSALGLALTIPLPYSPTFPLFILQISHPSSSPPPKPLPQLSGYMIYFLTSVSLMRMSLYEYVSICTVFL